MQQNNNSKKDTARLTLESRMLTPKFVASGFKADVDTILTKFTEKKSLRFTDFSSVWRELKCTMLFLGRGLDSEKLEFIGECFRIILEYVTEEEGEVIQTGALYLLYSFYFKQPFTPRSAIRVPYAKYANLLNLCKWAKENGHSDIMYTFWKLYGEGAFHFVAMPSMMGPRASLVVQNPSEDGLELLLPDKLPPIDMSKATQLSVVHKKYNALKELLDFSAVTLSGDAGEALKNIFLRKPEKEQASETDSSVDILHSRSAIRQREVNKRVIGSKFEKTVLNKKFREGNNEEAMETQSSSTPTTSKE